MIDPTTNQEEDVGSQLDDDVNHLWGLLFEIVTYAEKILQNHMADYGLTPPQFFVLKTLSEHEGCCPIGQIAREHHLTNATMTGLVKRLEAMQPPLVARKRSMEDGRSVDVVLTPGGVERFKDVQDGLMDQARDLLKLIDPKERENALVQARFYFEIIKSQFPIVE